MKKILIVEDVELNLDLLMQLLEDDYELVALPLMDGWEATRRIKADEALKHIPIIGISSHAMRGDPEKALAAGCDDYLTKPLDENLLFQKLDHFLGDKE